MLGSTDPKSFIATSLKCPAQVRTWTHVSFLYPIIVPKNILFMFIITAQYECPLKAIWYTSITSKGFS